MRAGAEDALLEAGADALAGHFHDAEIAYLEDLGLGAVVAHLIAKNLFDAATVAFLPHVDEVHDDHAPQVAKAELAGDLAGGLLVDLGGRRLGVGVFAEAAAVD